MRDQLFNRWDNFVEDVRSSSRFSLDEFKQLFLETWKYFGEVAKGDKISRYDAALIWKMGELLGNEYYPSGVKPWEYDAANRFLHGLVFSVCECRYPVAQHIEIMFAGHHWTTVSVDDFEEAFLRECEDFKENQYDGGIDYED